MKFEIGPKGYPQVREGTGQNLGRRIALHRLDAYAWGIIDDLGTDLEIDHVVPFPSLNIEENLEAVEPTDHGRRTRARERRRKSRSRQLGQFGEVENQSVGRPRS